jgi:hypothetical protein
VVALILAFILPGCWSGAPVENGVALSSSTTEEGGEKHEGPSEVQVVRVRARPPESPPATVAAAPKQELVARHAPARPASVAPKLHPSRFSVRRLQ